jgi:hypothetical protein
MTKGKRPFWKTRRRWEDNIKIYLRYVGSDGANWIIWLRIGAGAGFLSTVMRLEVP